LADALKIMMKKEEFDLALNIEGGGIYVRWDPDTGYRNTVIIEFNVYLDLFIWYTIFKYMHILQCGLYVNGYTCEILTLIVIFFSHLTAGMNPQMEAVLRLFADRYIRDHPKMSLVS
jgi:hypothetical protein